MNRIDLIKTLLPGFLPILVYILADSLFGEQLGLLIAIGFGLAELLYRYVKDKRFDSFIILDVSLITVLGLLSILLNTPLFFKMKPAVIETLLITFLLYSLYSSKNILGMMMARYSSNTMPVPSKGQIRHLVGPLIVILAIHSILTVISALWMSKEIWAFVSGGLFYIFFFSYFIVRILARKIRKRSWKKRYSSDEWFDIIDEKGQILFQAPRTICHQDPSLLHAVVHLHIFDTNNRLYLQKRPSHKLIQPNKWDTAVGGHISSGETIPQALQRESLEEINLNLETLKIIPLARYIWRNEQESEMVFSFFCHTSAKPIPNTEEITEGRFWSARQIRERIKEEIFSENFIYEFEQFLQAIFDGAIQHQLHTQQGTHLKK